MFLSHWTKVAEYLNCITIKNASTLAICRLDIYLDIAIVSISCHSCHYLRPLFKAMFLLHGNASHNLVFFYTAPKTIGSHIVASNAHSELIFLILP